MKCKTEQRRANKLVTLCRTEYSDEPNCDLMARQARDIAIGGFCGHARSILAFLRADISRNNKGDWLRRRMQAGTPSKALNGTRRRKKGG